MGAWSRALGWLGFGAVAGASATASAPADMLRQFDPTGDPVDHRLYARFYDSKLPAAADLPYALDAVLSDATVFGASHMAMAQANTAKWRALPGSERVQRWQREAPEEAMQATREGVTPRFVTESATREARRNADHVNENFGWAGHAMGRLDTSWEEAQSKMLWFVEYGHRALVPQFYVADGRVWIRTFDDIEAHAYGPHDFRWEGGEFKGLTVYDREDEIPSDRLLVLTFRQRGRDLTGHGFLEVNYPWWELKRHARALLAVAADRWAIATPVVNVDRQVARQLGYDDNAVTDMVQRSIAAAVAYASGEGAYLLMNPAVGLGVFGNNAFNPEALVTVIERLCDRQIRGSRLQGFLGAKSTTTAPLESTTPEQADFRLAEANKLDVIAACVGGPARPGRGAVARMLQMSYGAQRARDLPLLSHSGIHKPPMWGLLPHLPHLRQAGMATPTDRLEELIFELVGEVMPPEARRSVEDRLATKNNEVEKVGQDLNPSKGGEPAKPGKGAE